MRKKTIGWKDFGDTVDITDPGYDRDTWCRMNDVKIKPGNYKCIIWKNTNKYVSDGEEKKDIRVGIIGIYLDGAIPPQKTMTEIGSIGVDAGLAGFFYNKPDYKQDEWEKFCTSLNFNKNNAWLQDVGFFSESGYGDGGYGVYAAKTPGGDIYALEIRFM